MVLKREKTTKNNGRLGIPAFWPQDMVKLSTYFLGGEVGIPQFNIERHSGHMVSLFNSALCDFLGKMVWAK